VVFGDIGTEKDFFSLFSLFSLLVIVSTLQLLMQARVRGSDRVFSFAMRQLAVAKWRYGSALWVSSDRITM
jgi:hypothetical protein